jgi:hypothetical protein
MDLRIQVISEDLQKRLQVVVDQKYKRYSKKFKEYETASYPKAFHTALQKALHTVGNSVLGKTIPKVHLYCGRSFTTQAELEKHLAEGNCRPSRATSKMLREKRKISHSRKGNTP